MITRWQKAERYVLVRWYEDLAGDWIIEKVSGRSISKPASDHSPSGTNSCVDQFERFTPLGYRESKLKFRQICGHLRGQGFRPVKDAEVQLGFEF